MQIIIFNFKDFDCFKFLMFIVIVVDMIRKKFKKQLIKQRIIRNFS